MVGVLRIEVNGRPASAGALMSTYGHFTAMQVRGGGVQGLRHHLDRLDAAHRELFDLPLDGDRVRGLVRHALGDTADASVRVVLRDPADVLVAVGPPQSPPAAPQRLRSVPYLRPFPHLKHLGSFGQLEWARRCRREGYDDALLTGPDGAVSESSIANVGFLDADGAVVWPAPPWLHGTAMRLIEEHAPTSRRRITLPDLAAYRGAFLANSIGVVPVASIDHVVFASDAAAVAAVLAAVPWDPLDM